jgi:putative DNA primase/helicase
MNPPPTNKFERPEPSLEIRAEMETQKVKNTSPGTIKIERPDSLISRYSPTMFPLNLPSVVYCQQNNLLCYSAHASPFFDEKKGRVSKGKEFAKDSDGFRTVPVKGLVGWSPDALKKGNKEYTMVMMKTGFESGIVVIDLDICGGKTVAQTFNEEMLMRLTDDCGYIVQTGSGGYHFYFTIPEGKRWKRKMNVKTFAGYDTKGQLDILADGGGVIMEGSHYTFQNIKYTYEQMLPGEDDEDRTMDDITELPDWVLEAIEGCYEVKAEAVAEPEPVVEDAPQAPPKNEIVRSSSPPNVRASMSELALIGNLVRGCLPASFFASYDNWFRFICCLKSINNTEACKEICVMACRSPKKFNNDDAEESTRRKWEEVNPDGRMTMGTLRYWCRQNNEKKYSDILKESYELLLLGSVNDVAQVFAQDTAGSIVFDASSTDKAPNYWRYSEDQRLWTTISESSLDYYFVEGMPTTCDRVRRCILDRARGDEKLTEKAKLVAKIGGMIASGMGGRYVKPLRTILNPSLIGNNFKDREFSLNDRPELLPLKNGVWNFKTGKLEPYDRSHFLSYKIDINYNPDADTSDIDLAVSRWYENDPDRIWFMKYWLGYCLTGYIDRQEFMVVYGEAGGNGKSLLFEEILGEDIFGEYLCITLSEDALTKKGGHNDSLYDAKGKRLAVLSEAGRKGGKDGFNIEAMKKWSGGGKFSANAKYKNEIRFTPNAKIAMLANKLPELPADCGGVARRYLCIKQNIPFVKPEEYANYSEEAKKAGKVYKQDPEFVARLRANKEGWIKWLIEGAMMYMANPKKSAPASILEFSSEARASGDTYSKWLSQNLIITGLPKDKLEMRLISAEFCKDNAKSAQDTKSKGELIARLTKNPKITTSGNQAKGRLNIHGAVWAVGCNPDDDEDDQQNQLDRFNDWLGVRTKSSELMLQWLNLQTEPVNTIVESNVFGIFKQK